LDRIRFIFNFALCPAHVSMSDMKNARARKMLQRWCITYVANSLISKGIHRGGKINFTEIRVCDLKGTARDVISERLPIEHPSFLNNSLVLWKLSSAVAQNYPRRDKVTLSDRNSSRGFQRIRERNRVDNWDYLS